MGGWGAALAALAQIGGGVAGNLAAGDDREKQLQLLKGLLKKYQGIEDPRFEDVAPDTYGPSALEGIQSDPQLLAQQGEVDAGLKNISDSGGLTLEDRAAQSQVYDKLARQTSGQNASLRNNLASRGALNSGASIAMQQANAQQGTQLAADAARDTSARAQSHALKAMQQRYSNASQMDDAQYARKAAQAKATDAINAHNASARRNAGLYRNDNLQRQFGNQVTKVAGQRGPTNDLSGAYGDIGDRKANIGVAAGNAGAAYLLDDDDERGQR